MALHEVGVDFQLVAGHIPAAPEHPVNLMEVTPGEDVKTPIWDTYKKIVAKYDKRGTSAVGTIERYAFYDEAKTSYAILATSEAALYGNVMLQKGVVI